MYACVCACVRINNTPCLFQTLSLLSAEMSKLVLFNATFDNFILRESAHGTLFGNQIPVLHAELVTEGNVEDKWRT